MQRQAAIRAAGGLVVALLLNHATYVLAEPLCGEGGEELEVLVTRDAARKAFEYLLYFPKGSSKDHPRPPQDANEKTKQASILFGNALLERSYRLRAEAELARADSNASKSRVAEAEKAFLRAEEEFCKFVGHSLSDLIEESK